MSKRWLLLIIVAVAVVGFGAGVVAKEGLKYPYLPEKYSDHYVPTLAEWKELKLVAYKNRVGTLTSRLIKDGLSAYLLEQYLSLVVGTETQPSWKVYRGNGRFSCADREIRAAYQEAAEKLVRDVRIYFPGIAEKDVQIDFFILGAPVGTWQDGKMTLEGEE